MADTRRRLGLARLEALFPGRIERGEALRRQHANTLSHVKNQPPDAVVWAQSAADVARVVDVASEYGIPVIAFGAGTSLEGHVNAPFGGISIDMSRMNAIVSCRPEDLDCTVEAGTTLEQLNVYLRDAGLFFSVDPGASHATLGGMAASRASGTNTVRYGTMADNVLSLTAVLADASIVETGNRARKSSAGYDLTRLLIGSEGTLGIITSLTLRLHPKPEAIGVAIATFDNLESACRGAELAVKACPALARVELLDSLTMAAVNKYSGLSLPETAALFVEWHAMASSAPQYADALRDTLFDSGATSFQSALDRQQCKSLWKARHDAFWAIQNAWPGRVAVVTDACVPVSQLAGCIAETESDIRSNGLIAPIAGHAGDGNFHAVIMVDPENPDEAAKVRAVIERLSDRAAALHGTCSGEHGIGQGKMAALARQAGGALAMMRTIKKSLDPKGILNPGKIFEA